MLRDRRIGTARVLAPLAFILALVLWTASSYPPLTLALLLASLAMAGASFWSCAVLLGERAAWVFLGLGAVFGWCAEQMGASRGWFFGDYSYTEVLGPRLGDVPIAIPLMWFGLCYIGLLMASLALWRQPAPPAADWKAAVLGALLSAMIVTAFDLAADPYFVYVLKAWIMAKKDGHWFGETVRGFEGWLTVSLAIVGAFLALARPRLLPAARGRTLRAATLLPLGIYAGLLVFQLAMSETVALRVVAFFAMGIPTLVAASACAQWFAQLRGATQEVIQ